MALLLVGALTALIASVVLKVVDLMVEGRGSWTRRAIAADVALFDALPTELRSTAGADALKTRIDNSLIAFSTPPDEQSKDSGGGTSGPPISPEQRAEAMARLLRLRFDMEVQRLRIVALAVGAVLSGIAVLVLKWLKPEDNPSLFEDPNWAALGAGIAAGSAVAYFGDKVLEEIVHRRWKMRGWELPEPPEKD